LELGQPGQALASLGRALALNANFANAWSNRGVALHRLGRHAEALTSFAKSLALNPNSAGALSNRGTTLLDLNRHREAIQDLDRALALQPDYVEACINRGIAFTAPTIEGPYSVVANGENLLPDHAELEDPTIWWANDQYNVVATDWKGKVTGTVKDGVQYSSKDGITYKLTSNESVFSKTVKYDDGSTEACSRRERPFVYAENGEALALFTACLPNSGPAHIVVEPVDHYVPSN